VTFTLGLDLLITLMLAGAIAAAIVLNRKLNRARRDWQDLDALTGQFSRATEAAAESVRTLKLSTAGLSREIERADTLTGDLRFLIERAGAAADRLEAGVRGARGAEPAPRRPMAPDGNRRRGTTAASAAAAPPPPREARPETHPETHGAAATLAGAPAKPRTAPPMGAPAADSALALAAKPRSEAERALLEALRNTP
jgi:outer membrane murein-binding lipoprotein Lpp